MAYSYQSNVAIAEQAVQAPRAEPDKISLVIPAKNEAGGIAKLIQRSRPFVDEIIVVDGHSSDQTVQEAQRAGADKVILDDKTGKGGAYRIGARVATYENVVFMDADGSHDPAAIPALVEPLVTGKSDLVIGSRIKGGSDELHGDFDNFLRAVGSGVITACINYRFKASITDALNGFRAIKRSVFQDLKLKCTDFDIEQHMICRALHQGYCMSEVPTHEYVRQWGSSKLPTFRKAYLFLWRLFLDMF